ncbi:MAG: hypothetical protein FWD44_06555 [Oscillospiraceae bacterium]|nr:hypothetical protein [Oscillospiraceae bacterium]
MTLENKYIDKFKPYAIIFTFALIVYGFIYMFSGDFSALMKNHYNSYSRQAQSWLSGQLDLGENVPWLELAIYEGRYYVSFPPFPSVVMLPFVFFFGIDTPDNLIALVISLLCLVYAYKLGELLLKNKNHAMLLSLSLVLGTNYLHVSLWGAVWYIAQNMAFLLTLMAFYYALTENKRHSYIALFAMCAAMGCRPFNALYLPVVLFLIYIRENKSFVANILKIYLYSIPAIILGVFFMWLNYARFGDVLEFGHNYLPEFVNDPHGQFFIGRVLDNLQRMFFNFDLTSNPMFHGFAFWVASPIVISFVMFLGFYFYRSLTKTQSGLAPQEKNDMPLVYMLLVLALLHIVAFSFHRTLGGHQFGSRYTVDTLPAFYLGLLFILKRLSLKNSIYINAAPMLFGLLLNFYGTISFFSYYYG